MELNTSATSQNKSRGVKVIQNFYLILSVGYLVLFLKGLYGGFLSGSENFFGPFALIFFIPIGLLPIVLNLSVYLRTKKGKEVDNFAFVATVVNILFLSTYIQGLFYLSTGGSFILGLLSILIILFIIWHLYYVLNKKSYGVTIFIICILVLITYFSHMAYNVGQKKQDLDTLSQRTIINNQNAALYQTQQTEEMNREHLASVGMVIEKGQDGTLYVDNSIPGSLAYVAGLRTGDHILQVDGVDVRNFTNDPNQDREISLLADKVNSFMDYKQAITLIVKRPNSDKQIELELK